ncbi:hypothetical protein ACFLSE_00680 [Bacteroidota bacterium]
MKSDLLIFMVIGLIFGSLIGFIAYRKNRNFWLWGISFILIVDLFYLLYTSIKDDSLAALFNGLGTLTWIIGIIVILSIPALCPKCKDTLSRKERKSKTCPKCGEILKSNSIN